jgi:REP element-mobilizing transposase RayT
MPWQNSSMQFYRRNLPHMQRDYTPHFITFCTKFRRILPDWARDIVLECCVHDHDRRYRLELAVVMPDHVHLILTPLVVGTSDQDGRAHPPLHIVSLVEIMKAIKSASAHAINRQAGRHGTVWQKESFDRVVRSSESLDAKIAYILENPVRKALVDNWRQYRWIWQSPKKNPYAPPPSEL